MNNIIDDAIKSGSWAFLEAKKLLDRIGNKTPDKGYVLFETGYGPSGMPHIGTFGEVARTTMIIQAFKKLSNIPVKLLCFSDDMDGMRRVPTNLPNQEMLSQYLGWPLSKVPDPFEQENSFGEYMNNKLKSFLDRFGFEYELASSTEYYTSGKFDHMLIKVLEKYDEIMDIMLPSLREERRGTYSPFMPISKISGKVLQVQIEKINTIDQTICYKDEDGSKVETKVTGGNCKLQWKPDFAMRWAALSVDYEMYGKEHRPNTEIYAQICSILGGKPPLNFFYELFLNEKGEKISKSKGNSITVDEWIHYAPIESMSLYMYNSPHKAKRLYFDVIPKTVDEYLTFNKKYYTEIDNAKKLGNPVYHIHNGNVPKINMYNLNFALLLNLASACNPENKFVLWGFVQKYASDANPENAEYLDQMIDFAILYYNDFIKPNKQYLKPNDIQKKMLYAILAMLDTISESDTPEIIQTKIYDIGIKFEYKDLREYFKTLYKILFGQNEGPRMGSFIKLFGVDEMRALVLSKINLS
ncbi:MAG: lysine--tRNA ligase [Rickettsiaceae bacterium]